MLGDSHFSDNNSSHCLIAAASPARTFVKDVAYKFDRRFIIDHINVLQNVVFIDNNTIYFPINIGFEIWYKSMVIK